MCVTDATGTMRSGLAGQGRGGHNADATLSRKRGPAGESVLVGQTGPSDRRRWRPQPADARSARFGHKGVHITAPYRRSCRHLSERRCRRDRFSFPRNSPRDRRNMPASVEAPRRSVLTAQPQARRPLRVPGSCSAVVIDQNSSLQ
jgi:hypothetical protein